MNYAMFFVRAENYSVIANTSSVQRIPSMYHPRWLNKYIFISGYSTTMVHWTCGHFSIGTQPPPKKKRFYLHCCTMVHGSGEKFQSTFDPHRKKKSFLLMNAALMWCIGLLNYSFGNLPTSNYFYGYSISFMAHGTQDLFSLPTKSHQVYQFLSISDVLDVKLT